MAVRTPRENRQARFEALDSDILSSALTLLDTRLVLVYNGEVLTALNPRVRPRSRADGHVT